MEVEIRDDNLEEGLRIFKRKVSNDGVLKELKLRESFESKPQRIKRKAMAAARRMKKAEMKMQRRGNR